MGKRYFRQNKGISALLLTVILSLIMVIFIVGLTVISTRELRQSSQLDQSARALYGAEAGVQDALNRLSSDPSYREDCPSQDGKPTPTNVSNFADSYSSDQIAWVCRSVSDTGSQVEGTLAKDNAVEFDLTQFKMPNSNEKVTHVKVEYAMAPQGGNLTLNNLADCFYPALPAPGGNSCSNSNGYNPWTAPPAMELGLTWWPRGDNVTIYNYNTGTNPSNSLAASSPSIGNDIIGLPIRNILIMPQKQDQPQSDSGIVSSCSSSRAYNCRLEYPANIAHPDRLPLNVLTSTSADQNWIFRLRPRYVGTNYHLIFYNGDNEVTVRFPFAVIDVTGRSGDTYRRVKAYKPLTPSNIYNNLDNVLVSGTEICKNLTVDINHNGVGPGNPGGMNICNGRTY